MAISFVRRGGSLATKTATTSISASVPAAGHAAGNTVLVALTENNGSVNNGTVTDSKGNTYTLLGRAGTGTIERASLWGSVLTTALVSGDTITYTTASLSANKLAIDSWEFSGLSLTLDAAAGTAQGNSTTPSGSTTPVSAATLIVGLCGGSMSSAGSWGVDNDTTNGSWSVGPGPPMGSSGTSGGSSSSNIFQLAEGKLATAAGAQTFNPTWASATWQVVVVALKPASTNPIVDQGSVALAAAAGLGGAGTAKLTEPSVSLPAAAGLSGAGTAKLTPPAAQLDALASLSGAGGFILTEDALNLAAVAALTGAGGIRLNASAALAAAAGLSGSGITTLSGSGSLAALAALSGAGSARLNGSATLAATAGLAGSGGFLFALPASTLSALAALSGSGATRVNASTAFGALASLSGFGDIVGGVHIVDAGTLALDASTALAGLGKLIATSPASLITAQAQLLGQGVAMQALPAQQLAAQAQLVGAGVLALGPVLVLYADTTLGGYGSVMAPGGNTVLLLLVETNPVRLGLAEVNPVRLVAVEVNPVRLRLEVKS